jgi:hypothetical protein
VLVKLAKPPFARDVLHTKDSFGKSQSEDSAHTRRSSAELSENWLMTLMRDIYIPNNDKGRMHVQIYFTRSVKIL